MRTLKVRAWDTQYNQWAYFTLDHFISGDVTDIAQRCKHWCESTGLKDKNGVEIYEGDIIRTENDGIGFTGQVVYSNGAFRVEQIPIGEYSYIEVLGNVYENPERLEVKND